MHARVRWILHQSQDDPLPLYTCPRHIPDVLIAAGGVLTVLSLPLPLVGTASVVSSRLVVRVRRLLVVLFGWCSYGQNERCVWERMDDCVGAGSTVVLVGSGSIPEPFWTVLPYCRERSSPRISCLLFR